MEMEAKEVAGHNEPDNAWFTTHGKVCNATEYLRDHPGGADILIEAAGTDATEAFGNAGHSKDAREMMESFLVGTLKGYRPKKPRIRPEMRKAPEPSSSQSSSAKLVLGNKSFASYPAHMKVPISRQPRRLLRAAPPARGLAPWKGSCHRGLDAREAACARGRHENNAVRSAGYAQGGQVVVG